MSKLSDRIEMQYVGYKHVNYEIGSALELSQLQVIPFARGISRKIGIKLYVFIDGDNWHISDIEPENIEAYSVL